MSLTDFCLLGAVLLQFYLSASFLKLLLQALGLSLGKTFLNCAGRIVNELLSLFQAKTGEFLNQLNYSELAGTGSLQDYVESALLLSGLATGSGSSCHSYSSGGGLDTVLFLQDLSKFVYFLYCEVNKLFCKSFQICHCRILFFYYF